MQQRSSGAHVLHDVPDQYRQKSNSQALAALCTAGIDDLAAILGAHAGQKAMNFLALTLFRLKSSLHGFILRRKNLPPELLGIEYAIPIRGQACNSTVYRSKRASVKHFFVVKKLFYV